MGDCFADVTVEFLAVAFDNILYFSCVYPKAIFETRKKYNMVIYKSVHPELNQFLELCLKSIAECLKSNQLKRVEFVITDGKVKPLISFIFDLEKQDHLESTDSYLIQTEMNFRTFFFKLSTMDDIFQRLPEDTTFTIYLHTNEATAVSMAINPDVEDFPMIEVEKENYESHGIVPITRFYVRQYSIDTYVEINYLNSI